MKIAFIGEQKCSISNMLALALTIYSESNKSILIVDAGFRKTDLEDAFRGDTGFFLREEDYYGIREGMDYFLYRMRTGPYNSVFTKEGATFVTERLAFIKSAIKGDEYQYESQINQFIDRLLDEWDREFDLVLVKCDKLLSDNTKEIINRSDVCVACFAHDYIMKSSEELYKISQKKIFYILVGQVIGSCNDESKLLINICRVNENKIGLIPYNPYFEKKISDGGILKLFVDKKGRKASVEIFLEQMKLILHRFRKWLEEIGNYE